MTNSGSTEKNFHASAVLQKIGRPVAYYPNIAKLLGSVKSAIFLCQFLYWEGKQHDPAGWIYKTREEITEETGLSREEQDGARKRLRDLGILREKKKGLPCTLHFLFNWERFDHLFDGLTLASLQTSLCKTHKLDCVKPANLIVGNPQTGKSSKRNTGKGSSDFSAHQRLQAEITDREYNRKEEEGQPSVTHSASLHSGRATLDPSSFSSLSSSEFSSKRKDKNTTELKASSFDSFNFSSSLEEEEQPTTATAKARASQPAPIAGGAGPVPRPRQRAQRPPAPGSLAYAESLAAKHEMTVSNEVRTSMAVCSRFIEGMKSGELVMVKDPRNNGKEYPFPLLREHWGKFGCNVDNAAPWALQETDVREAEQEDPDVIDVTVDEDNSEEDESEVYDTFYIPPSPGPGLRAKAFDPYGRKK